MSSKGNQKRPRSFIELIIAFIIFIITLTLLSKSTNIVEDVLISYDKNSTIDYKVYIFKNAYIKEEYMEKGKTYISDLVKKIDMNFNFEIKSSKEFKSTYKYDITATTTVKHNSTGKELWTEKLDLVKSKDAILTNNDTINIANSASLPYNVLNNKVKSFKTEYNIPVTAYVEVRLTLRDTNGKEISSTGLTMDLFEDTFEVTENDTGKNIQSITETKEPNKLAVRIELIVLVLSAMYIVLIIYTMFSTSALKKSYYAKAIYKILRNYGDIVAEVVKPIDLSGLKIIDVKNFDQMLDVEEELRIPIMFYETVKNYEGHFILVHQDMAYRYILKDKHRN